MQLNEILFYGVMKSWYFLLQKFLLFAVEKPFCTFRFNSILNFKLLYSQQLYRTNFLRRTLSCFKENVEDCFKVFLYDYPGNASNIKCNICRNLSKIQLVSLNLHSFYLLQNFSIFNIENTFVFFL